MSLKQSYTLLAPFYDLVLERISEPLRRQSLADLDANASQTVLIAGIGSGLDIPLLPKGPRYTGVDLTPAMLRRAEKRAAGRDDITLELADVMALPYKDAQFDVIVMHLILAVVPDPEQALREAERVLRPDGQILLLDKFLRPGQKAPLRRLLNTLSRHLATRTDVVFEEVLACCPSLSLQKDQAALANGWFRQIRLKKMRLVTAA